MMKRNQATQSQMPKRLISGAMVVLFAISLGASGAYAYENVPGAVQGQTVQSQSQIAETEAVKTGGRPAGLLPGDFFYFIKTIYEQIRLALTTNDLKEAQLLAEFAQNRLSEANALLAKGKVAEATQSVQKSLEVQQSAVEKTEKVSIVASASSTAASTSASEQPSVQIAGIGTSEATDKVKVAGVVAQQEKVKDKEKVIKVKNDLQHNITALTAALEKVENPKAQLALMKNIEKSFARLEEKLEKIERKKEAEPVLQSASSADSALAEASNAPSVVLNAEENAATAAVKEAATASVSVNPVQAEVNQEATERHTVPEKHEKAEKDKKKEKSDKPGNLKKEDKSDKREQPAKEQKNDDRSWKDGKHNDNNGNGNRNNEQGRH